MRLFLTKMARFAISVSVAFVDFAISGSVVFFYFAISVGVASVVFGYFAISVNVCFAKKLVVDIVK